MIHKEKIIQDKSDSISSLQNEIEALQVRNLLWCPLEPMIFFFD